MERSAQMSTTLPAQHREMLLTGWGNTAPTRATVFRPADREQLASILATPTPRGFVARGLGRSYGDPAQNAGGTVIDMTAINRIIDIDLGNATVETSAGISLHQLLKLLVPLGLFVPVTPGTRYVTVGGAIASDIHGKNHHRDGTFGQHVVSMRIITPEGHDLVASPANHADLFNATIGGMGLTGFIVSAVLRMIPIETSEVLVDTRRAPDLETLMSAMVDEDDAFQYSVAWVDTFASGSRLGRGVLYRANHARATETDPAGLKTPHLQPPKDQILALPRILPASLVGRRSTSLFNRFWYLRHPENERQRPQQLSAFFHQLDIVGGANHLYGSDGLVQHQCVIPEGNERTLRRIIERLAKHKVPTPLVVLKRMGPARGLLSFPLHGWTLAVDIPAAWPGLGTFLDRVDEDVVAAGGRLYLAKDSRMRPELLSAMYPELPEWRQIAGRYDPGRKLNSDLSRRLHLRGD